MWYYYLCAFQEKTIKISGEVYDAPMTGAINAYLGLAYNLFLLAHNNDEIHDDLIHRLKLNESFHGAYYEAHVSAMFIKAGFNLEFENEQDGSTTHCEFTATCKKTGNKYSVEAKTRAIEGILGKNEGTKSKEPRVRNQLVKALRKKANHKRIVFIDINVPDDNTETDYLFNALKILHNAEEGLIIHGKPAPEAYVALTNFPYDYHRENIEFQCGAFVDSFKINDFRYNYRGSLREAINAREKHKDICQLIDSMRDHYHIPSTFDGEFPEFTFYNDGEPRLLIGKEYMIPDGDEKQIVGKLVDAVVLEAENKIYGVYKTNDGRQIVCHNHMTDAEVNAYKRHPSTFFGVLKQQQKTEDVLGLYDFFLNTYKNTPKEKLLEFLSGHSDFDSFKKMSQEELVSKFCEISAESMWYKKGKKNS
jgi:hypothetical protein